MSKKYNKNGERYECIKDYNKRYYAKTANIYPSRKWSNAEIKLVMQHNMTDRQLSGLLGRSMSAIQYRRHIVNKERRNAANQLTQLSECS